MRVVFLVILFLFFAPVVSASGVIISEVLFDPSGVDTGQEWIELYNTSPAAVDVSGWQLYPDGIGYFSFPQGFLLSSHGVAIIHLRASGTNSATDLYFSSPAANMGNTSGSAALFSGEPKGKDTIKSFVQWGKVGETWENAGSDAGLWNKGEFIDLTSFTEGSTISLNNLGFPGRDAWKISPSTPGVFIFSSVPSSPAPASSTAVSSPHSPTFPDPPFSVYAGEDVSVAVGSDSEFFGTAYDENKKLLESARFWWNFGDGTTKEGRLVSHIFTILGTYLVGLHVSNGSFAASDYQTVTVISNKLAVQNVVQGVDGFIRLSNPSDIIVDIGGWIIEDGSGMRFFVPAKTKVAAHSEIAVPNSVTGLFKSSAVSAIVRYPNGVVAVRWEKMISVSSIGSANDDVKKESASVKNDTLPQTELNVGKAQPRNKFASVSRDVSSKLILPAAFGISILAAVLFLLTKHFIKERGS